MRQKKLFLGDHLQIGQRLGARGPLNHALSRVLGHQMGWNRSLLIRPYAVVLRIERVLQLEHGLVTSDGPTDVLCCPVSQLLAELKPIFAVFHRFVPHIPLCSTSR